jgi:hypothetical protein
MILIMTADALVSDWKYDIIHDILFTRILGPIFYYGHPMSILVLTGAGFYQMWKMKQIARPVIAIFATASVHEYAIELWRDVARPTDPGGISLSYGAYLIIFLILAAMYCTKHQKRVIVIQAIVAVVFYYFDVVIIHPHPTNTGFGPGPGMNEFWANLGEVGSWALLASFWLLPKRLFLTRWERRNSFAGSSSLGTVWRKPEPDSSNAIRQTSGVTILKRAIPSLHLLRRAWQSRNPDTYAPP